MNSLQDFNQFLSSETGTINLFVLLSNVVLAAILAAILSWFYISYGASQSNRHSLANVFVLLAVTTTLVITVVKSSLALSLGLVGALSIVRFRAAIKEPEELAFLFLSIAIGLGFGADQRLVTVTAFFLALLCFVAYRRTVKKNDRTWNFYLTASGAVGDSFDIDNLAEMLKAKCNAVSLKRYDQGDGHAEAVFYVEFRNYEAFTEIKNRLDAYIPGAKYMFVEDVRVL